MKKRLGFFGGCFNPVTNAHIALIKDVISKEKLDTVYFVPMGNNYQKNELVDFEHRINMLKLVFEDDSNIEVLEILSNKSQKTYAIDTFKLIDKLFEDDDRFFIMGSDNYECLNNWRNSDELIKNYKYIVLDRNKESVTKNISSSLIRKKIKLNENVDKLLPNKVIEYIRKNQLYR